MTILELDHRLPEEADLEAAWERGLDAFRPWITELAERVARRRSR
jgi:hypothetical protein